MALSVKVETVKTTRTFNGSNTHSKIKHVGSLIRPPFQDPINKRSDDSETVNFDEKDSTTLSNSILLENEYASLNTFLEIQ